MSAARGSGGIPVAPCLRAGVSGGYTAGVFAVCPLALRGVAAVDGALATSRDSPEAPAYERL